MRAVYGKLPTPRIVAKELRRLGRELDIPMPGIAYWSRGDGQYDHSTTTIKLPSLDWLSVFDPDIKPLAYWIMVLHEYAHHLHKTWYEGGDHGDVFYTILTSLALSEDIPLDVFYADEHAYKPRSFKLGRRLAGRHLLWKMRSRGGY